MHPETESYMDWLQSLTQQQLFDHLWETHKRKPDYTKAFSVDKQDRV